MEFNQHFDYRILDSLISKNIRFAIYKLARQQEINLILETSPTSSQIENLSELNNKKGFVIAPFYISVQTPVAVIYPDVFLTGESNISKYFIENDFHPDQSHTDISNQPSADSFRQYAHTYDIFYEALKKGELQKLVLSRTFDVERKNSFSAGTAFRKAHEKYDSNFVYLCNTPETGVWMGVSPELLVSEQNGVYKTVALAGTRKLSVIDWDTKNQKEQQIVVDYMLQQLDKVGSNIIQRGPFTVQAGAIEHLKTKFSFNLREDSKIGDLLSLLHPSPAVCGYPKTDASEFILKNESYERRYYSGFVGPLNINNNSRLYVNLRCMQIGPDILRLYAGGGILTSSRMETEWEETEYKLQTIRSIIE